MAQVTVLERAVYGMSQVDHLLGLHAGTARRWIDGYTRGAKQYPPVIREKSTGVEAVTWGEFIEARLLASYRSKDVPLVRMRPVVERLREELGTPYPLAFARLYAEGRELVAEAQEKAALDPALRLVYVVRTGQYLLAPAAEEFVAHVEWSATAKKSGRYAARLRPLGDGSAVTLDPERSFGAPAVGNVRTDVIIEEFRAGDSADGIAQAYGISRQDVDDALRYELTVRAAA